MDQLQDEDGPVVDGTRHNVVNNQVCLVTWKGSGTEVTGLSDIEKQRALRLQTVLFRLENIPDRQW